MFIRSSSLFLFPQQLRGSQVLLFKQPSKSRAHLPPRALIRNYYSSDVSTRGSHSVNEHELTKFAKISNEWWDPHGAFKYLHTMNAPRIRFIRDTLVDLSRQNVKEQRGVDLTGLRAVDVGCGGGLAAESLARLGLRVLGIDAARENVEIARLHQTKDLALAGSDALEYRQITAEQLLADTSNRGNFDAVVSLEVIEHVTDPFTFVRSLVELARPGAPIIVSTMNRTPISYLVDIAVPEYLTRMVPRGTHEHGKFIKPEELRLMLRACGAEMLDVRGLVLDPVTNVCHLVDRDLGLLRDVGVQANYIMAARKNK